MESGQRKKPHDNNNNKVPPDGGYGWVIVFSNALSNFITVPLMHCFGLLFKDTFASLGLSATQGALIINLNAAFGMMAGPINGLSLKTFGCRKVALVGAFLLTSGVVLTSYSSSFAHFVISYGLITSLGMWMSQFAYSLAVNMYFKKKRSKAMGFSVAITGFGPILIPQLFRALMKFHTVQGVTLIYAGICAHVFIAAILLQPVEWHMKAEDDEIEDDNQVMLISDLDDLEDKPNRLGRNKVQKDESTDREVVTICGLDSSLTNSNLTLNSFPRSRTSSMKSPKKKPKKTILVNVAEIFDLDLLKDPIFLNILVGLAFAMFAEINFTILTPFILRDIGLNTDQIATFLSTLGVADIIFRFLAAYIGDAIKQPSRIMYSCTLILLVITRFSLLLSTNFYMLLLVAFGLGVAKGVRKVYRGLVIPDHVPIEKLASASGIEMLSNGACILTGGTLLGLVRDATGSYTLCIIIMNCVTLITVTMWTAEALICRRIRINKKKPQSQEDILLNTVS